MKHSMPKTPRRTRLRTVLIAAFTVGATAAVTLGGSAAFAGPSDPGYHVATHTVFLCTARDGSGRIWGPKGPALFLLSSAHNPNSCPNGYSPIIWDTYPIPANTPPPAPPTVVTVKSGAITLPHIGGSWSAGHVKLADTVHVDAGTYQVDVNGDFYRAAASTATPGLQIQLNITGVAQVTAITGPFPYNANMLTGLANDGTPRGFEQTASASNVVVIPAGGADVELDAFGYNPDTSGDGADAFGVFGSAKLVKLG